MGRKCLPRHSRLRNLFTCPSRSYLNISSGTGWVGVRVLSDARWQGPTNFASCSSSLHRSKVRLLARVEPSSRATLRRLWKVFLISCQKKQRQQVDGTDQVVLKRVRGDKRRFGIPGGQRTHYTFKIDAFPISASRSLLPVGFVVFGFECFIFMSYVVKRPDSLSSAHWTVMFVCVYDRGTQSTSRYAASYTHCFR